MKDKIKTSEINSKGFGIIPKLIMKDKTLSIQAKSVYAYMRSYTGAGNTCYPSQKTMCVDLNISNKSLTKYIKELVDKEYIWVEQEKNGGKFSNNTYTINELFTVGNILPYGKSVDTESLHTNNNNTYKNNNDTYKSNTSNPFIIPPSEPEESKRENKEKNEGFNKFWELYPKKVAKQQAIKSWEKINPDEVLLETIFNQLKKFKRTKEWQEKDGQFIPHPSTWLNNKRWEDEIKDNLPEWFSEEQFAEDISEEEKEELNRILKEIQKEEE